MSKILKNCLIIIFGALLCLACGALYIGQTSNVASAEAPVSYTDAQLKTYDTVSVHDLFGVNNFAVPPAFGSYYEKEISYEGTNQNTTGSVVFEFRLTINSWAHFERLIALRCNEYDAYRFFFGVQNNTVMMATIYNGITENQSEAVEFLTNAPSTVDVEIAAIDLKDGSGVWQYVKINGKLLLSKVQPLLNGVNTKNVYIGGNDCDPWLLTEVGCEPVMPEETEVDFNVPAFTDDKLAVYDIFSVYELFGVRELIMYGSAAYYETQGSFILNQVNTTNSAVLRMMFSQDNVAEMKEKLITLRAAEGGLYGYRFYLNPIKIGIDVNGEQISSSLSPRANVSFKNREWYELELGAINLADGSGVWQYVKVNGELLLSTIREVISVSGPNVRIGGNATEDWRIRDLDYDNLPEGDQPVRTGIVTEKGKGYENVIVYNIEDLMSNVAYMGLGRGTTRTSDGNIRFERISGSDVTPLIQLKPKKDMVFANNFGIKFASVNDSVPENEAETVFCPLLKEEVKKNTVLELGLELCAPNMGIYWGSGDGYLAYFVWDPIGEMCRILFFPKGPDHSSDEGITFIDLCELPDYDANFLPHGEKFTVEYGCFSENIDRSFTLYVLITNSRGKEMYVAMTWGAQQIYSNAKEGGYVRINGLAYERSAPIDILSVDENSNVCKEYSPAYEEARNITEHDISDFLPIGQNGITYKTSSADEKKDIINISKMSANTKNDMYLQFSGDYNLRLALFTDRYEGKNCTAGYQVVFTPNVISILSYQDGTAFNEKIAEYTIPLNQKVHVAIRLVQLYVEGVVEGVRLSVFVEGEPILSGEFDLQVAFLPPYFDGQFSGNGSVTIYPYDTSVKGTNGVKLDVKDEEVAVGKQIRLKYSVDKKTENDVVSYRIVSGDRFAELKTNNSGSTYLVGVDDGTVSIVAQVENEYGVFVSEAKEIVVGTGKPVAGSSCGCSGSVDGSAVCLAILLASVMVLLKRKKEK